MICKMSFGSADGTVFSCSRPPARQKPNRPAPPPPISPHPHYLSIYIRLLALPVPNEPVTGSPNGRCFLRVTSYSFLQRGCQFGLCSWYSSFSGAGHQVGSASAAAHSHTSTRRCCVCTAHACTEPTVPLGLLSFNLHAGLSGCVHSPGNAIPESSWCPGVHEWQQTVPNDKGLPSKLTVSAPAESS
jgi:hypothetical protein